jgi:hypothetical protein
MFSNAFIRRGSFFLGLMLLMLVAVSQIPSSAMAAYTACGGDPTIYLSDGTSLSIVVNIGTGVPGIKSVVYNIHAAPGVKITKVVYTPGPLAAKERVKLYTDNQPGFYKTHTVVSTQQDGIAVSATTTLSNGASGSASGYSPQDLVVALP